MARKYDPLKSNRSSYFTKPKKTWSDKRSGDSVGRGLKRGTYEAYTAYHSRPKKSTFKVTTTRRTRSTKSSATRRTTPRSSTFLERLRELSSPITPINPTPPKENSGPVLEELPYKTLIAPKQDSKGPIFGSKKPRNTNHCPYCNFVFPKAPKRGRVCENCGKKFVVRSNCVLYNSNLLTLDESAANDCFAGFVSIDTPVKLAKRILAKNPHISVTELFVKMVEAYDAANPHDWTNNSLELESFMYQNIAKYEEKCGRDGASFREFADAKAQEYDKIMQDLDKRFLD